MMIKPIKQLIPLRCKQQGNILIMFTISLFSLIVMASLALDGGHLLLNKGKLQNLVDTAALHAALELDNGATHSQARAAAVNIIQQNLAYVDHHELADVIDLTGADIYNNQVTGHLKVEFSQTPDPFMLDNTTEADYVKVSLLQLDLNNFLADVFNFNKQVSATALAGRSTTTDNCFEDLVPMVVCGDPTDLDDPMLENDSIFGLTKNTLHLMKIGSNNADPIGPGNFQLLRLGTNTGANDIRAAMAGESGAGSACFTTGINNNSVSTEPGNTVGPVAQGLNTRMGIWNGPVNSADHLRDMNACHGESIALNANGDGLEVGASTKQYSYTEYEADNLAYHISPSTNSACTSANTISGNIVPETNPALSNRRVMGVVIADCSGKNNGANELNFLGVGCFFLTQRVENSGPESYVVGEFIDACTDGGPPSSNPVDKDGPYKIVLFHVPGSTDS